MSQRKICGRCGERRKPYTNTSTWCAPCCREYHREYRKRWTAANPGKAYAYWKKSRLRHPETRREQKRRNYQRGAAHLTLAERTTRRLWNPVDDEAVLAHEIPDRDLAIIIRRSTAAIMARRSHLKKQAVAP